MSADTENNAPTRLSKVVMALVPCSRREAEQYIEGGWVLVNGKVIDEPYFKIEDQQVELHPDANLTPIEPATLIMNLPAELSSSPTGGLAMSLLILENQWAEDNSGVFALRKHFTKQTYLLPLQEGASGLALFSQDWRTVRKATEDAGKIEQEYVIEVSDDRSRIDPGEDDVNAFVLRKLNHGMNMRGKALPRAKISWQSENRLRFAIKAPEPGQLRFMCESVGLQVLSIKRIRLGGTSMGKLPSEQWRYVTAKERL
ncbi:hypothetical protein WH50_14795 [Pokkaliibacter plantistimulans]|uniref:Dual-specificity RNA pseudouridine synthase RluF n=2 Tax=Pseudomonadota TaxID=1224 RepID=A0ABX5LV05_9GAMM|nr:RNA pseudouridine synthase [Pokkaliibacter plantistimulans]PPC75999.1 RNA-binding protein [Pokkaliibacter plantistimulans]PXF30499.1 hypothetical protein WH50_14795 [Pokkaliibacter plantistimulans]